MSKELNKNSPNSSYLHSFISLGVQLSIELADPLRERQWRRVQRHYLGGVRRIQSLIYEFQDHPVRLHR